ncbi:uncharacterized protein LOC106012005, partial [Aplysia californica]|uniref:Uncharacterized protein LOC106012005 n=1 Tax=Aplysia californica TaxID=6500 RepID=A0ABM1A1L3_APLCA
EDDDENDDCSDEKKNNNNTKDSNRDEQIDVVTESGDVTRSSSDRRGDNSSSKHHEPEVSHCRLSPELPRGPAYIASDHAHVDLDSGKPKIWSVTDFLSSAHHPAKDGPPGAFSKLDTLKSVSDLSPTGLTASDASRANALLGRSVGSSATSNGLSPLSSPAHHLSAYQSTLGYGVGAYPYALSSYGGAKLLRPSMSAAAAVSRFSPFPSVRPMGMDSPYIPRRDIGLTREGE